MKGSYFKSVTMAFSTDPTVKKLEGKQLSGEGSPDGGQLVPSAKESLALVSQARIPTPGTKQKYPKARKHYNAKPGIEGCERIQSHNQARKPMPQIQSQESKTHVIEAKLKD